MSSKTIILFYNIGNDHDRGLIMCTINMVILLIAILISVPLMNKLERKLTEKYGFKEED